MSSPLFGLSILVHICIIFVGKFIAPILKLRSRGDVPLVTGQTYVVSTLLIMVAMSGVVVSGAVGIVYTSVTDEYSSIRVVGRYLESGPVSEVALAAESEVPLDPFTVLLQTNTTTDAFKFASDNNQCEGQDAFLSEYMNPTGPVPHAQAGACQTQKIVFNYPL